MACQRMVPRSSSRRHSPERWASPDAVSSVGDAEHRRLTPPQVSYGEPQVLCRSGRNAEEAAVVGRNGQQVREKGLGVVEVERRRDFPLRIDE